MRPPLVSVYARYPEDMRLVRTMLARWKGKTIKALYIGPAYGEDYFSWLTVGFGVCGVYWSFLEIDEEAYNFLHSTDSSMDKLFWYLPPMEGIHGDFTEEIKGEFDIIIANHVWKNDIGENKDSKDNINGLRNIIAAKPSILIARDLQYKIQPFKACLQDYDMVKPFVFRRKEDG